MTRAYLVTVTAIDGRTSEHRVPVENMRYVRSASRRPLQGGLRVTAYRPVC